jgi:hypothetical protein
LSWVSQKTRKENLAPENAQETKAAECEMDFGLQSRAVISLVLHVHVER